MAAWVRRPRRRYPRCVPRVLFGILVCGTLLVACRSPEPRSPEVVRQKATEPREPSIFDRLPLDPARRRAVDELLAGVRRDFAAYEKVRLELLAEIAVQVRQGAFDRAKLEPLIERAIVEYERVTPALVRFANQVHRTLSRSQRKQLVELWDEDDEKLSEEERRAKEEEELSRVLDLTGGQRTRLMVALLGVYLEYYGPIGDARKSWGEAKLAFQEDAFEAGQLGFFTELPLRTLARAAFDAAQAGLSVLSPAQRETLAATIESQWR